MAEAPRPSMFEHLPREGFDGAYTDQYNRAMIRKFLYRRGNHWADRIRRVFDMVGKLDVPGRRMLDLGCSIGTMAVDFSQQGWEAAGVDLDGRAVETARRLAGHLKLDVDYRAGDVADRSLFPPASFDLVVAGDIIEHLPQPVLETALANVRVWLRPGGWLVFHTAPTRFDQIFHKSLLWLPLAPAAALPDRHFTRLVRLYDRAARAVPGLVRESETMRIVHCNLQEPGDLRRTLERSGLEVVALEADVFEGRFLGNPLKNRLFRAKTAFQRNLLGAAWKSILP